MSPTPRYYQVQGRACEIARAAGHPVPGAEHAFLAIVRDRETVPARALSSLVDLDVLEAAVLEVKHEPPRVPAAAVFLPEGQVLDGPLETAIRESLPEGATYGVNTRDGRMWIMVGGPGDTQGVVNAVLGG